MDAPTSDVLLQSVKQCPLFLLIRVAGQIFRNLHNIGTFAYVALFAYAFFDSLLATVRKGKESNARARMRCWHFFGWLCAGFIPLLSVLASPFVLDSGVEFDLDICELCFDPTECKLCF